MKNAFLFSAWSLTSRHSKCFVLQEAERRSRISRRRMVMMRSDEGGDIMF
jgi:hypothetical protein